MILFYTYVNGEHLESSGHQANLSGFFLFGYGCYSKQLSGYPITNEKQTKQDDSIV